MPEQSLVKCEGEVKAVAAASAIGEKSAKLDVAAAIARECETNLALDGLECRGPAERVVKAL